MSALTDAATFLFVPGNRKDRFAKAADSGADMIILDLEDAVGQDAKPVAREAVAQWLADGGVGVVRVNAAGTPWFADDVAMAARYGAPVMLPKADDPDVVRDLGCAVIPLIENARGVALADDVCAAPGVERVAFGTLDLAAELGIDPDDTLALTYARSRLVVASAAAGIAPPIDGVVTDVRDDGALAEHTAHARRLGFAAKLCIHPRQISVVRQGFAPSENELDWARRVVGAGEDVAVVDGAMVDKPVIERARRLLARER